MEHQDHAPRVRTLAVDLDSLELAFEGSLGEATAYLDLHTGEVVIVTDEIRRGLEEVDEGTSDDPSCGLGDNAADEALAGAIARQDLPEWMREAILEADQVERGLGSRYIDVPRADSREGYHDMEVFIDTVCDEYLQARLRAAIRGRGAFRRFKDLLAEQPHEEERWYTFKDARVRERALAWLASLGVMPTTGEG